MKNIFAIILVFLLVFSFRIPLILNGAILAFIFSIFKILTNRKSQQILSFCFRSKYVVRILIGCVGLSLISFFPSVFHETYDFSVLNRFVGLISTLFFVIFVYSAIFPYLTTKLSLQKIIFIVFGLQSVIQIIAFKSPSFLSIIQLFQDARSIEIGRGEYYKGVRGLALSTELFFGLSCAYGLVYIQYIQYMFEKRRLLISDIGMFLLLIFGTFFVGRSGLLGLVFGFSYILLSNKQSLREVVYRYFKFFIGVVLLLSLSFLVLNESYIRSINDVILPEAFEFIYNYMDNGKLSTSSTDGLLEMLQVPIDNQTFLIGQGKYEENGKYYMETDSGYLRQILYGGIGYVFCFMIYQLFFFVKNQRQNKASSLINYIIYIYLMILHIKGETLGTHKMVLVILMLLGINELAFRKITFNDKKI